MNNGSSSAETKKPIPLWLLAELTYACPLQCPYCSNPINFPSYRAKELNTQEWSDLFRQARSLGAVQLGLSGGEPMVREDLYELVEEARQLGFYSNLITSGVGLSEEKIEKLRQAGLDHIQLSFQGSDTKAHQRFAGTDCFDHKKTMARAVKAAGYPMVLNFVLHRHNIDQIEDMLLLAKELNADYVELANTQYYGWAKENLTALIPSQEQLERAEQITEDFRNSDSSGMKVFFVVPDYYNDRPKPCSNGWGTTFITAQPDGSITPCQSAHLLPGVELPNIRNQSLAWIWQESELFNQFRGDSWMQQPCQSCPEKDKDFGGCRCQAFLLTGDANRTDPACSKSSDHHLITQHRYHSSTNSNDTANTQEPILRNTKSARIL